jgi:hypothetical protein
MRQPDSFIAPGNTGRPGAVFQRGPQRPRLSSKGVGPVAASGLQRGGGRHFAPDSRDPPWYRRCTGDCVPIRRSRWPLQNPFPAIAVGAMCALCGAAAFPASASAQTRPELWGTWTLNRDSSEFPREVGFDPDWVDSGSAGGSGSRGGGGGGGSSRSGGGGRGGRGGGGSIRLPPPSAHFLSEEDARKMRELVADVKEPSSRLTISRRDATITIADDRGRTRAFRTNAKEDTIQLDAGPIGAVTKWEGVELLIRYRVSDDQELRRRYSRDPATGRLVVREQLADHGRGQVITRAYDAAPASASPSP